MWFKSRGHVDTLKWKTNPRNHGCHVLCKPGSERPMGGTEGCQVHRDVVTLVRGLCPAGKMTQQFMVMKNMGGRVGLLGPPEVGVRAFWVGSVMCKSPTRHGFRMC